MRRVECDGCEKKARLPSSAHPETFTYWYDAQFTVESARTGYNVELRHACSGKCLADVTRVATAVFLVTSLKVDKTVMVQED